MLPKCAKLPWKIKREPLKIPGTFERLPKCFSLIQQSMFVFLFKFRLFSLWKYDRKLYSIVSLILVLFLYMQRKGQINSPQNKPN